MSQQQDQQDKKNVFYDASRLLVGKTTNTSTSNTQTNTSNSSGSNVNRLPSILPPRNMDKPTQHFKTPTTMTFTPNFKPNMPIKTKQEETSSSSGGNDDINLDVFMGQANRSQGKRKPNFKTASTKAIVNNRGSGFNLVAGITPSSGGLMSSMIDIGGMEGSTSSSTPHLTASGFGGDVKDDDVLMEGSRNDNLIASIREKRKNLFRGVKQPPMVIPFNEEILLKNALAANSQSEMERLQALQEDSIDEIQQGLFKATLESLMSEDQLFFIQLPSKIPYFEPQDPKVRALQQQKQKQVSTSLDDAENIWTQTFENTLDKVPNGQIGEMIVYKSGKVKLKLGDVLLDVFPGSDFSFPEHVACIDIPPGQDKEKQGSCYILGNIEKRFSCVPDVDYLLKREQGKEE
ncbi:hypothetical protein ABK040_005846 [Willaertia magna]